MSSRWEGRWAARTTILVSLFTGVAHAQGTPPDVGPRPGGSAPQEPRPAADPPQEPRGAGRQPGEPRPAGTAPGETPPPRSANPPNVVPHPVDDQGWRSLPPGSGQMPAGAPGARPPGPNAQNPNAPLQPDDMVEITAPKPLVTLVPPPQANTPLTLHEVMENVAARYPLLLAEMQAVTAAEGDTLSANGAFDPKWKTKASVFPVGYYQYGTVDSVIEQPLYYRGLSVFGGYRIGQGKFPIYYDGYRTNDLGEARVGVSVPILRGGSIDEDRAKLWKAEQGIIAAKQGLIATQLEFQRNAAYKYWEWIAASKKLEVARTLLKSAVDRKQGLDVRVVRGDAAAVEATDNARAIVQREQQVVAAERTLTSARLALSLYLRDEKGNPVIPSADRVPEQFPEPTPIDSRTLEIDLSRAFTRRPEIKQYEARRKQYEIERDLAKNDAWPSLNVMVAGAKQFGEGFPERQPAILEGGLFLDIPLRTRKADGRARAANARFVEYELELRYAKDKISVEVHDAAAGADAAAQRLELARKELKLARQLEAAERKRFDMGDSNFLFVNIREQATFEAANRELDTLLEHQKALALYTAVIGGMPNK